MKGCATPVVEASLCNCIHNAYKFTASSGGVPSNCIFPYSDSIIFMTITSKHSDGRGGTQLALNSNL